jgi:hypothetical protein
VPGVWHPTMSVRESAATLREGFQRHAAVIRCAPMTGLAV